MNNFVDSVVEYVRGGEKHAIMHINYCLLVLLPLFVVTDYKQLVQVNSLFWTILNVVVRTQWPSQYNPGRASLPHWYSHPYTARVIATVAEFVLYYN